jgi:hypothetical protein
VPEFQCGAHSTPEDALKNVKNSRRRRSTSATGFAPLGNVYLMIRFDCPGSLPFSGSPCYTIGAPIAARKQGAKKKTESHRKSLPRLEYGPGFFGQRLSCDGVLGGPMKIVPRSS